VNEGTPTTSPRGPLDRLDFLSPDRAEARAGFEPTMVSPLARAFAHGAPAGIEDISLTTGKLEVRGAVEDVAKAEVVRLTPDRALVLCDYERCAELRESLDFAVDMTGALAGLIIDRPDAERLMRRVTDLDLDQLPAAGSVAHMPATVLRDGPTAFRLFFPQEFGHSLVEIVFDATKGLG
jgi:sarcosine oxidase gamma subunit